MPFVPSLFFACAVAVVALWADAAQAEVRRCETAGGQTIFTDRKCTEVDAVERLPRTDSPLGAAALHRGCARSLQDLVFEMTTAIDGRDANRLAAVYHWPGTSAESGYQIWTRLDAVVNRPLVDIVPVTPMSRPPQGPASDGHTADSISNDAAGIARADPPVDPALYPQTSIRRKPVALRVEQTLANGATPSRTVFGLTHYFGCWWIRF